MKKALIVLLVLLVALGIGVYFVLSNLDSIAKGIIEESGSETVGTEVRVESVAISLREGSATVKNLTVANPPGFSDLPAFRFSEVTAEVETSGVVRRIYTSEPEVRVEFKGDKSNFDVLSDNIRRSTEQAEQQEAEKPEDSKGSSEEAVQVQIDEVQVDDAKATVTREGQEPIELNIESLRFENLKGSPAQITRIMLGQFVAQVVAETAKAALMQEAERILNEKKGELEGQLGDQLEKLLN